MVETNSPETKGGGMWSVSIADEVMIRNVAMRKINFFFEAHEKN
jgi:hypothetical protein